MGERKEACPDSGKKVITEGKAEVLISSSKNVFYNPVQEFNRDLRYVYKNVTYHIEPKNHNCTLLKCVFLVVHGTIQQQNPKLMCQTCDILQMRMPYGQVLFMCLSCLSAEKVMLCPNYGFGYYWNFIKQIVTLLINTY